MVGRDYLLEGDLHGRLHRGRHRSGGEPVMIKLVAPQPGEPLEARASWLVQAERWSRQQSPSLAEVLEYGCEPGGRRFLVMKWCAGPTLRRLLDEGGALAPARVEDLLRRMAEALQAPHRAGLVHGGLNLDAVLVEAGGEPVIVGFEAHLPPPGLTSARQFLAPEQIDPEAVQTAAVDLFAIGVIGCQLLAGSLSTCAGSAGEERRRRALSRVAGLPDGAARALAQILGDCLQPDPRRRPTAEALARRLGSRGRPDELRGVSAGSYRLLRPLGAGGLGSVWLAEHPAIGSRAAVKVLRREMDGVAAVAGRFRGEAEAVNRIESPHLCRIFDYGRLEDGREYLTMELLEGETLDDRLARCGTLPGSLARKIAAQVARGLAAAHAAGVIHRDIKPHNVHISGPEDDPGVKLFDFGIAKIVERGERGRPRRPTSAGVFLGTPRYASPEQLLGVEVGAASDVYSLGLVLLEMLCGKDAIRGTHWRNRNLSTARLDGLGSLQRLVMEMLDGQPELRPSMATVVERLEEVQSQPGPAPCEEPLEVPRSRRWMIVAALALLVAGLVVGLLSRPASAGRRPAPDRGPQPTMVGERAPGWEGHPGPGTPEALDLGGVSLPRTGRRAAP